MSQKENVPEKDNLIRNMYRDGLGKLSIIKIKSKTTGETFYYICLRQFKHF